MTTCQTTAPITTKPNAQTTELVDAATLAQWLADDQTCLVDVREAAEYSSERIAGSCLLPLSEFDVARLPQRTNRKLVLSCLSGARSQQAAQRVIAAGLGPVWQLKGGINGWKTASQPVKRDAKGPSMFAVQRQAFVVIGIGVLTGLALGYFVAQTWLLLAAFFACGLVMAGTTGTCPLAIGLAKLPWNRRSTKPAIASPATPSCCAR